MSAYMCDNCHLTALAAYVVKHGLAGDAGGGLNEQDMLELLHSANERSLIALYPGESRENDEEPLLCKYALVRTFAPVEIVKAANVFIYQACHDKHWPNSTVSRMMQAVIAKAVPSMPEYEAAVWGINCPHTPISARPSRIELSTVKMATVKIRGKEFIVEMIDDTVVLDQNLDAENHKNCRTWIRLGENEQRSVYFAVVDTLNVLALTLE